MSYKRWIFIAISLFGIGLILGFSAPGALFGVISEDIADLAELGEILSELPRPLVAIFIFLKNASSLVLSFALSPVFCLMPVLALTLNGCLLALVSVTVAQQESIGFVLAGLLPHGVFEIPALIIGQAAALYFGATIILAIFKRDRRKLILPSLKESVRYLIIALILLLPAAIIETFVTPLLLT